jgi:hypothetical protein
VPCWWLIGYIGSGIPASDSAGPDWFTANLNTFFNSFGYSNFLRPLDTATPGQYEGFGYLGIGIILFLFYTFSRHGTAPLIAFWREQRTMSLSGLIGFVISLGTIVSLFAIKIEMPIPVYGTLLAPFRSIGRYIWIPAFVITIFTLYQLVKKSPLRQTIALSTLLILQIWDYAPFRSSSRSIVSTTGAPTEFVPTGLPSDPTARQQQTDRWLEFIGNARAIVAYPPLKPDVEIKGDYELFWWLALKKGTSVNIGYVSRFDTTKVDTENQELQERLQQGNFKDGEVYIVGRSNQNLIGVDARHQCQEIGLYLACRL